jgi:hypothetical protein
MNDLFTRGASASINKTIAEIDSILDGSDLPSEGKLREKLRAKLNEALTDSAVKWMKHGFKGGHNIAAKEFARTGSFPRTIGTQVKRNMPVHNVSPTVRNVLLKSTLAQKYADRLDE